MWLTSLVLKIVKVGVQGRQCGPCGHHYAGGGAFIGYEFYDPRKDLPANIDTKLPTGNFLYGIFPSIEAAFFVTRQLALTVSSVAMINFSSPLVKLRPQIRMGLKIDI